ncbi:MAG TPA: GAF domain-containing protein, partial [Thermoanaerobaculia bacterium]|nr:GAF domain-containing protein [Thermoanaerobaculia bacterium]
MRPEVEELRPKLKEILYDCAVDIRATKAALYLFDGTNKFELLTEYGFRGNARPSADFNDPVVDRCGRGRIAFFINGLAAEPRFSPMLFEASTDRLLVAPLYERGKLIGFLDLRDKPAQAPFEAADAKRAQQIADRMVEIFAEKNLFGHRYISLSRLSDAHQAVTTGSTSVDPAQTPSVVSPHAPIPTAQPPVRTP